MNICRALSGLENEYVFKIHINVYVRFSFSDTQLTLYYFLFANMHIFICAAGDRGPSFSPALSIWEPSKFKN